MDLGILSGFLGGQKKDNSMLATLLPMLLGGKLSSNTGGATGDLLSSLFKGAPREKGEDFPPLFGGVTGENSTTQIGLSDLLGKVMSAPQGNNKPAPSHPEYPYELQYNRPFKPNSRDK